LAEVSRPSFLKVEMKILFTGMASSHCTKPKNTSFFVALSDLVSEFADVVWDSPKFSWTRKDLDEFDYIFFGLTPPTSLSANKIYPALRLLSGMFASPKLILVADGAQMWQYKNSFEAVKRDYRILLGPFYAKRSDYSRATESPQFLVDLVKQMETTPWPKTIYPRLPWNPKKKINNLLGFITEDSLFGFNLDASLISQELPRIGRSDYWSAENMKSSWLEKTQAMLSFPVSPNKIKKTTTDEQVLDNIQNSVGLILPPQERDSGTWWNYRIFQAINTATPIITQWQETIDFNPAWGKLGYQIEDMSTSERASVAAQQRYSYISAIPTKTESQEQLRKFLIESNVER
jgi:hypothetical protein